VGCRVVQPTLDSMLVIHACLGAEPMHEESWIPCVPAFLTRNVDLLVRFVFEEAISNRTVIKRLCQTQSAAPRSEASHLFSYFPRHSTPKYLRAFAFVQRHPLLIATSHNVHSTPSQRGSLERGVRVARLSSRQFQRYDAINKEMSASSANPWLVIS